MFYCEECRQKNNWPQSISKSTGKCECCGAHRACWGRPSSTLPPTPRATPPAPSTDCDAVIANARATGILQRPENIGKSPTLEDYHYSIKVTEAQVMELLGAPSTAEGHKADSRMANMPPLPEPRAIRAGYSFPKVYALGFTADQMCEYGQACVRAALAAKPVKQPSIDGQLIGKPAQSNNDRDVDVEAERKLFEAWARNNCGSTDESLARLSNGGYEWGRTADMFCAWKASAARRTQAEGAKTKPISDAELLAWMRPHLDNADGGYLCDTEPQAAIAAGRAAIAATQKGE